MIIWKWLNYVPGPLGHMIWFASIIAIVVGWPLIRLVIPH
jgi:hypothetical protein